MPPWVGIMNSTKAALALSIALLTPSALLAQAERSTPIAAPLKWRVPDAVDAPYPGTIMLDIDATDTERGLFRVTETIPVAPGAKELILLFPQWLPGNHAQRGPLNLLVDMRFFADGMEAKWERDPLEPNAFHIVLPDGASEVTARFVHTSPLSAAEGRVVMTQEMLNLQWEKMSLYPAGHYVRQIRIRPTVTFPEGWAAFTALDGQSSPTGRVSWAETDYETLVDSPIFAGEHSAEWDLGHEVSLKTLADEPGQLEIKPEHLETFRNLVEESLDLFGVRHFDQYEFLLALTDRMGGIGLEHQRSSENQYEPDSFTNWQLMDWDHNVIAHEFVHSWNGKYRRPAALWTPDYRTPMQNSLLWVYEGQTQFWGHVLAARSGLQRKDTVLGIFASIAGQYAEAQPGRSWRSLEDTTFDPMINSRTTPYPSMTRRRDYYSEGALIWLEADQIIREGTRGKKGLDDFALAFFGMNDGDIGQLTYEYADVIDTLNAIYPHDWDNFFQTRVYSPNQPAPLAGIQKAGYQLVWKEEPNPYDAGKMRHSGKLNLKYSLGLEVDATGRIAGTVWDSPAFQVGLVKGAKIVAVNGEAFSAKVISKAISKAKERDKPIKFMVQRDERLQEVAIHYTGGLRYPWLEPAGKGKQPFDELLAPRR